MRAPAIFALTWILAAHGFAERPQPPHSIYAGTGKSPQQDRVYAPGQPDGQRTELDLGNPFGIELVGESLWITTVDDHCIYRGKVNGESLVRVAGTGRMGYGGDGGPADQASFNWPHEVRADKHGNL